MRKRGVLLLVFILISSLLVGCTGSKPSAETLVQQSYEKMAEWKSYEMDMGIKTTAEVEGEGSMEMTMDTLAAVNMEPSLLMSMESQMEMKITANGASQEMSFPMTQFIEMNDNGFVIYQNMEDKWVKTTINDPALAQMAMQDPTEMLKSYMENLKSAEIIGEERIQDRDCYKVNIVLGEGIYDEVLEQIASSGVVSPDMELTESMLAGAGDLAFTMWIDKESDDPIKMSMDLSSFIGEAVVKALEQEGASAEEIAQFQSMTMVMEAEYKNINNVQPIVIPEAAKSAEEIVI